MQMHMSDNCFNYLFWTYKKKYNA